MTKSILCMNPGPIEFEPKVLKVFASEGISHVDKHVIEVFGSCLEKLRHVFIAPDGQPIVVAGSGTLGWDMVGANLLKQGDTILVINTGYFGDHFGECLEQYGGKITHFKSSIGVQPSLSALTTLLTKQTYDMVTITHVDTSTGVRVNVKDMVALIRKHQPETLLVLDGVCATGGEETRMKEWDIDVVLTGSQKCIAVPAGLSIMVVRPRALSAYESKKHLSKSKYYVDWSNWLPIMKNYEARKPSYFATPSVNHLLALQVALDILLDNGGMEQRFKEYDAVGKAVKEAMKALGLALVTAEDAGANTLTCVKYPDGVEPATFLPKVVANGVSLAGGLHPKIKTKYFRIGHMGPSTRRLDHLIRTIAAIEDALLACGHTFATRGAGVKKFITCMEKSGVNLPLTVSNYCGCPLPKRCQMYTLLMMVAGVATGYLLATKKR